MLRIAKIVFLPMIFSLPFMKLAVAVQNLAATSLYAGFDPSRA